jgi:hypothetical protein
MMGQNPKEIWVKLETKHTLRQGNQNLYGRVLKLYLYMTLSLSILKRMEMYCLDTFHGKSKDV